jgi:hypothetical protein
LSLDLDQRHGWPAELRILLDRHPRESWPARRAPDVQFWLEIHDQFRHACIALETLAGDYREGRKSARELAVIAAPRLRTTVSNLHGHHQVEDFHYFPAFRAADGRLAAGFDVLGHDHDELQRNVTATLAAMRELRAAVERTDGDDSAALAARQYVAAAGTLCRGLIRHLSDEEDLVIPLLLERGDY